MNVQIIEAIKKEEVIKEQREIIVSPYVRVSTSDDEQLNSYESQLKYYTNVINEKPGWKLGEIYADEGISGTQVNKRDDFQRMIIDAMDHKIDMIITKSISRFARNTVDTLKYVRLLKDLGIAVYFEKENINTMTMDGEVLLTILSSLAQQESESISLNVKMGLSMKMSRGEIVGSQRCLGYDYDKETKTLSINEREAEIVKYIFRRYIEGAGGMVIARELTEEGIRTIRGNVRWDGTSVLNIIKNEKYVGDLLLGKTITTDPISHRKIKNKGEEKQYLVRNHHEPIISREVFEQAHELLSKRSIDAKGNLVNKSKYSRKHAFSSITKCGHCGSPTTRRKWHGGKPYEKYVWQCATYLKYGKDSCPESKAIDEDVLENAFVHTFNKLQENNNDTMKEFIENFAEKFKNNDNTKKLERIEQDINKLEDKLHKLVDMRLENTIDKEIYELKYNQLSTTLNDLRLAKEEINKANVGDYTIKRRIKELEEVLSKQENIMVQFDREVFDKIIDEVVLGAEDKNRNFNPYIIVFKLKSGLIYKNEILFNDENRKDKMAYANYVVSTRL